MVDRLAESGAIKAGQESTATVGTVSRLAGAGQIEAEIRRLVAEGFYTAKVAAYTVKGRLINAALDAISIFSPSSLFANDEVGAWYDPSDVNVNWRRNLFTYTQEITAGNWTSARATEWLENGEIAPDGTATAITIKPESGLVDPGGSTYSLQVYKAFSSLENDVITFSVYVKPIYAISRYISPPDTTEEDRDVRIVLQPDRSYGVSSWNCVSKEWETVDADHTVFSEDVGNGWYRIGITYSCDALDINNNQFIRLANRTGQLNFDPYPSGDEEILIWGAQAELNDTATAYQRIVTPEITYVADVQPQPILYQNSTGTTPVTAVEQPVGLMLDKSQGLVLGSELVTNGDFSDGTTGWTGGSATLSVSNGVLRATSITRYNDFYPSNPIATVAGRWYKLTYDVITITAGSLSLRVGTYFKGNNLATNNVSITGSKTVVFLATSTTSYIWFENGIIDGGYTEIDNISVKELPGNHAYQTTSAARPTLKARYNLLGYTEALSTQNVTTIATDYTLYFTGTGSITLSGTATGIYTAGTYTVSATAGTLTLTVLGDVLTADLRVANDGVDLPAYQRVGAATDYDTVGFPVYLSFDGTDDSMATNSIDFTGTDKMTVWAGVRKLSDAAQKVVAELSATIASNNGTFLLAAPDGADATYAFDSKGTTQTDAVTGATYPAPTTNILTGISSISGDATSIRVNAINQDTDSSNQGTGNYGNYPLYIGSRGGSSLRLNGRLYSMIVRGAESTATEITDTEDWVNNVTKAY